MQNALYTVDSEWETYELHISELFSQSRFIIFIRLRLFFLWHYFSTMHTKIIPRYFVPLRKLEILEYDQVYFAFFASINVWVYISVRYINFIMIHPSFQWIKIR